MSDPPRPDSRDERDAQEGIVRLLSERAGMLIPVERMPALREATLRAMSRSGVADLVRYVESLQNGRVSLTNLLDEVTIGETYFYREPKQFEFLRLVAIPRILELRGSNHHLRMWSAASSSGEEPYSLAMLAADLGLAPTTQVVGTDISRDALVKARKGTYGKWSLRDQGLALARHHLAHVDDEWRVTPSIRRMVQFSRFNLADDDYQRLSGPFGFDVILCRNVLIYLDRETIARAARGMYDALAPGGYLIMGSSDPAMTDLAPFESVTHDGGLFYRRRTENEPARPSWDDEPLVARPALFAEPSTKLPAAKAIDEEFPIDSSPAPPLVESPRAPERESSGEEGEVEKAYREALQLGDSGRLEEAIVAIRRALYLAPDLLIAHFVQGVVWRRRGDANRARRSFRTVRTLCTHLRKDDEVPLSDGLTVGYIDDLAATHLGERARQRTPR